MSGTDQQCHSENTTAQEHRHTEHTAVKITSFIRASDLDAAEHFYGGVLGLELEDARPFALVADTGATQLRITVVDAVRAALYTVLGWQVDDIESTIEALVTKGVQFTRYDGTEQDDRGLWTTPSGPRIAGFRDPDGNNLSLQEAPSVEVTFWPPWRHLGGPGLRCRPDGPRTHSRGDPMPRRRWAAVAAALALSLSTLSTTGPAQAQSDHRPDHGHKSKFTFAVIGDLPYGQAEIDSFPANIAQINADPDVQWVSHLGDIKNGSSVCSDEYFQSIKTNFDRFDDPFVYTIGDNEWTDCHRPNNGAYNPLERLDAVRDVFFSHPGYTLGNKTRVTSDAAAGYPENVRYVKGKVSFAAVHIVGSNNSLAPWTGNTTATPEQTVEVLGRTADAIAEIHAAFADGRRQGNRAVVIMTQADMFDPTAIDPQFSDYYAFQPIVAALARESRAYGGPVYLFNGDSHLYNSDRPLAAGSPWLKFYGVTKSAPNLRRITVDGSDNSNDYLKVTTSNDRRNPLSWVRVPYTS